MSRTNRVSGRVNVVLSLSQKIIWCRKIDEKRRKNHDRTQEFNETADCLS